MSATAESARSLSQDHLTAEAVASAIHFTEGLVGCPDWRRFVPLVDADEDLPVAVLQCLDDPDVSLLVTDPQLIEPGYSVPLSATDRIELGLASDAAPVVYSTLTVGADGSISANLLGPLVINPATRRGRQLVLADSSYSTRHPVAQVAASPAGA